MNFYAQDELEQIGFASLDRDVRLSRTASIYGASRISIGRNSRIDDFCVLSAGDGGIEIGHHVHIAVMCTLIGKGRIAVDDFATLSGRVSVYSSSDDQSGGAMTNPTIPAALTHVDHRPVAIGRHVIVGAGSVILPGACLGEGVAVGALSLVNGTLEPFTIYAGVPARVIRERRRDLLALEARLGADGDA